jgi:hypothetical protein
VAVPKIIGLLRDAALERDSATDNSSTELSIDPSEHSGFRTMTANISYQQAGVHSRLSR